MTNTQNIENKVEEKKTDNNIEKNVGKCCPQCGFDPIAFANSIPNFEEKLQSDDEFLPGGSLEHWRGALASEKPNSVCWTCAH